MLPLRLDTAQSSERLTRNIELGLYLQHLRVFVERVRHYPEAGWQRYVRSVVRALHAGGRLMSRLGKNCWMQSAGDRSFY